MNKKELKKLLKTADNLTLEQVEKIINEVYDYELNIKLRMKRPDLLIFSFDSIGRRAHSEVIFYSGGTPFKTIYKKIKKDILFHNCPSPLTLKEVIERNKKREEEKKSEEGIDKVLKELKQEGEL